MKSKPASGGPERPDGSFEGKTQSAKPLAAASEVESSDPQEAPRTVALSGRMIMGVKGRAGPLASSEPAEPEPDPVLEREIFEHATGSDDQEPVRDYNPSDRDRSIWRKYKSPARRAWARRA